MKEKLNKIPSHWRKLFLLLLSAVGSLVIGVTAAAIIHEMSLENRLKTPTVEAEVVEDLTDGKKVQFRNNGTANVFVRVAWAESWTLPGSPAEVLSNYCQDAQGNWVEVAVPNWLGVQEANESLTEEMLWQYGGDGWWYYRKVLPPKGTTEFILKEVNFDNVEKLPSDPEDIKKKYKRASYDLHFTVEEVQASADHMVSQAAIQKLFGISGKRSVEVVQAKDSESWNTLWSNKDKKLITWQIHEAGGEGN